MDCGWRDEVAMHCRQAIAEGNSDLTVDDIIDKVTPQARSKYNTYSKFKQVN